MINAVFGKTIENVRKCKDIKCKEEGTIQYLNQIIMLQSVSPKILAIEINYNKKTEMLMNRPLYFGLSVLELSKISVYEF